MGDSGRPPRSPRRSEHSIRIPEPIAAEIAAESERQDRSISWLVMLAWRMARDEIRRMPTMPEER